MAHPLIAIGFVVLWVSLANLWERHRPVYRHCSICGEPRCRLGTYDHLVLLAHLRQEETWAAITAPGEWGYPWQIVSMCMQQPPWTAPRPLSPWSHVEPASLI
jgi:hypothetical protein